MTYPYIHFFNIQYWYCVIVSLFGAHCTETQLIAAGLQSATSSLPSISGGSITGTVAPAPGFWAWLFGSLAGSGSTASSGAAETPGFLGAVFGAFGTLLAGAWALFSVCAFIASFLLLLLILLSAVGILFIRLGDEERYGNLSPAALRPHPLRARWQALLEGTMVSDPKRWKEGILGADQMLGELFMRLGYEGETTSDRIRQVPEGAFANLPSAWEAHRIKNFISAPSSHFILTQREAFRVMKLYERVFREFDFI